MPRRYAPEGMKLGQCRDLSAIEVCCVAGDGFRHWSRKDLCRHKALIPINEAIARWGEDRRMDDLPVRCSKCGAPRFDKDGMPNVCYTPIWPHWPGQGGMNSR